MSGSSNAFAALDDNDDAALLASAKSMIGKM
jgi:hypothetical protein